MIWALGLAAYQAFSSAAQADAIRKNAELSRHINEMNAESADLDAYRAEQAGYTEADRYQTVIDSTVGAQRVAFASQNVDVNFGTAKQVQAETRLTGYLNTLDILTQGHSKALGYKNQASQLRLGGYMSEQDARAQANMTQTSGIANAFGTGISGYTRDIPNSRRS